MAALLLFLLPLPLSQSGIRGNDGVQNYAYLRSLLFDGDLDFSNEYNHYFQREPRWFNGEPLPRDPVTGRPINLYGVGSSLLWSPWVMGAHAIGRAAAAAGVEIRLDGYSRLYGSAVALGSWFYAGLGLVLLLRLLERHFGTAAAFWATFITWMGTPLLFYMGFHGSMSHANSFFLLSLLLFLYLGGDSVRRWAAMGFVAGLLVVTRFQDGILLCALAAGEGLRLARRGRRAAPGEAGGRLRRYAAFAAAALPPVALQLAAWNTLQGTPFSGPRAYMMQGTLSPFFPRHLFHGLFSPWHGLFHWHPFVLPGLLALLLVRPFPPPLRAVALAGFLAQAWVVGGWSVWWAGASFGQRMFISALPFLAIGLAAAARALSRPTWLVPAFAALSLLWNWGLILQYGLGLIPRQEPVWLSTLAWNNLVELPRLLLSRSGLF